jgi:hypothetical protein
MRASLALESLRVQGSGDPIVFFNILGGRFSWPPEALSHWTLIGLKQEAGPVRRHLLHAKCSHQCAQQKCLYMHKALHTAAQAPSFQVKFVHVIRFWELHQKTREGFFSIYKTRAVLLCLSHALIQLQSVCAPLELNTSHSRVPTAVYLSPFYKFLFGNPSADLVFGSPRPSTDTSEGPCAVEVILNLEVPATATKESRICFCSSSFSSV